MTTRMRVEDKVAAWYTAYNAVREELTPRGDRNDAWQTQDTSAKARHAANDRTAALVAALIVGSSGTRPIPTDAISEEQ